MARVGPGAVSASLGLLAAATPALAETDPESVRLVVVRGERTETCSDRAAMSSKVSARLGRNVFSESAARSIEAVLQHEGEHWEAHVYVRDAGGALVGSRYFASESPDCAALDAAVALAVALTIDPDAALRSASATGTTAGPARPAVTEAARASTPAPSSPAAGATPPVAAQTRPKPDAGPVSAPSHPWRPNTAVFTTRALLVAPGVLPSTAGGLAFSTEAPSDQPIHGSAGLMYLPEAPTPDHFAFGLTAAWLGVCAQPWRTPRAAFTLCATSLLGAIHAVVPAGYTPVNPGERIWAAASLSAGLRVRLIGPLLAELGGQLLVPIPRTSFTIAHSSGPPEFREQAAGIMGFAGLGVSIP